jgi:hypothetical protein
MKTLRAKYGSDGDGQYIKLYCRFEKLDKREVERLHRRLDRVIKYVKEQGAMIRAIRKILRRPK